MNTLLPMEVLSFEEHLNLIEIDYFLRQLQKVHPIDARDRLFIIFQEYTSRLINDKSISV